MENFIYIFKYNVFMYYLIRKNNNLFKKMRNSLLEERYIL